MRLGELMGVRRCSIDPTLYEQFGADNKQAEVRLGGVDSEPMRILAVSDQNLHIYTRPVPSSVVLRV